MREGISRDKSHSGRDTSGPYEDDNDKGDLFI